MSAVFLDIVDISVMPQLFDRRSQAHFLHRIEPGFNAVPRVQIKHQNLLENDHIIIH